MNLRRLQHLVALAEEGNFRRAAERVHLSQPAFSRSIQAAESELGLRLFDRLSQEVRVTQAGAFVVERARRLLQQSTNLNREVLLYRDRAIGDLVFGTGPFPAGSLVPSLLVDLRARHPDVRIRVHVTDPKDLIGCVRREEHEFFVGNVLGVPADGQFDVRKIGRVTGGLYVRAGHPLLESQRVTVGDLLPFGVAAGRQPHAVQARLRKLLGLAQDQPLPLMLECDDIQLLRRVAKETDTVIVATDALVSEDLAAGRMLEIVPVDLPRQQSDLGIVTLAGRTPSPIAAFAMDYLVRAANARSAPP